MDQIFWLSSVVSFDEELRYTTTMELQTELCPANAGQASQHAAKQRWSRPLRVIGPVNAMTDFEWTVYGDILISEAVASELTAAGFTGFELRAAEVFTSTETPIGREVSELRVFGWGGVSPLSSGVRIIQECPVCKRRVYSGYSDRRKLFDIEQWDGSDFFVIWPLPRQIMVTGAVRDYLLKAKYSGLQVRPLDELPNVVAGTLTPGHLHDWFEESEIARIRMTR